MDKIVYNIVWADDQIDDLLDDATVSDLAARGFNIKAARNGHDLEACLSTPENIDAVIVDANFNEVAGVVNNERDTSGLNYARGIYIQKLNRSIPFFIFTGRSDELLKDIYKDNPSFLEDFPRNKRWFSKSSNDEFYEMLDAIKQAVDEKNSPEFVIRNRYKYELNAATLIDGATDFVHAFLLSDYNHTLNELQEPLVTMRKLIEQIFSTCQSMGIIPPISDNLNGVVYFLQNGKYGERKTKDETYKDLYVMKGEVMPKPLAKALSFAVSVLQDGAHAKSSLTLKVSEYLTKSQDILFLKSVGYIVIDVIKWFAITALYKSENGSVVFWKPAVSNNENSSSNE